MNRHLIHSTVATLSLLGALAAGATTAEARQVRYVGLHPVPDRGGGGLCYIEASHVHVYSPARPEVLYRVYNGEYYFVGDPVAYDYDGPRHNYYGHHPVDVDVLVEGADLPEHDSEFCYLDGPHYHSWSPPASATFTVKGDASWYIGAFPPSYTTHRKRYIAINAIYRPLDYARPVVVVDPPVGYLGPVIEVHGAAPAAVRFSGPEVHAGIEVHVPVPTFEVGFGFGGIVIDDHEHGYRHDHRDKHKVKRGKHVRDHRRGGKGRRHDFRRDHR